MLTLLNIPTQCIRANYDRDIPVSNFFKKDSIALAGYVHSVKWYASMKPGLINARPVKTKEVAYEEIQVFQVEISDSKQMFYIANALYKHIKYPCILIIKYEKKYCVGVCPFTIGKVDFDKNILKAEVFSHWIYPDLLSPSATKFISAINQSIEADDNLRSIYTRIYHAVQMFRLKGTTKTHVNKLLCDLLGKSNCSESKRNEILKYCTPYKKHMPTSDSLAAKYDSSKRTSNYVYSYDYEDIWYCLMKYEQTRTIIEKRKYRDIDDLIFTIDSKIYDSMW